METETVGVRPQVVWAWIACLAVAMAPWLTGGREPVGMLVSGFALLLGALLVWRQPQARSLGKGPLWWSYVGFMGVGLLSLLWTANQYSTQLWIVKWILAGLAFRLAYAIAGEPRGRRWMVITYVASAALFCVVAIYMYLTNDYDRLIGTFYWPNPAAAYLMPAILIALDRLRRTVIRREFWWWVAGLSLFVTSFLLTSSRASMIVLSLVVAVFLIVSPLTKRLCITYVFVLIASLGLSIFLSWGSAQLGHQRTNVVPGTRSADVAAGSSRSVSDRIHYIQSGLEMWFKHPVLGVGAGTYGDVHPQYQRQVVSASSDAHNVYLQTLAELGLLGALLLASAIAWLNVGMFKGLWRSGELLPLALGVGALGLHFGLDIDAAYPALLMLLVVLAGLVYEQWRPPTRRKPTWIWPAVAVVILAPIISLYQGDAWAQRAKAAQRADDYELAAQNFAQASSGVVFNPDWVNAEGINLLAQGQPQTIQAGLERARQAQKLDRFDAQHYQLEARALALQKKLTQAQAAAERALELDALNHPEYALDLAAIQMRRGNLAGARSTLNSMIGLYPAEVVANRGADATLKPALANVWALRGAVDLQQGQLTLAREALAKSLSFDRFSLRAQALKYQLSQLPATR